MDTHFGMIGLGTMGRNFALNVAGHGFGVCGYDRDETQLQRLMQEGAALPVAIATSTAELIRQLHCPRIIMLLVPAGKIVDVVVNELTPMLSAGDVIIDGGNSHFTDTDKRYHALRNTGIHFIGMGVSGGAEGARFGPSMMPAGSRDSYNLVKDILTAVAAKAPDGESCVAYMGQGAAGHYIKMVHNGIEYAMMQLISEIYSVLKSAGYNNSDLHELFKEWNKGPLESFLIEITASIFTVVDEITGNELVDMVLDKAKQKGTGLWASQSALELNVPVPIIDVAVSMRYMSSLKEERVQLSKLYTHHKPLTNMDKQHIKGIAQNALHFGFIMAYCQGIELIKRASDFFEYTIDIKNVIKVWRAGCIIRSRLLNDLHQACINQAEATNILSSEVFVPKLTCMRPQLATLIGIAMEAGIPAAACSAALYYFDAYTTEHMTANLIQAQRDFFGAHSYERTDKEGVFHTQWGT